MCAQLRISVITVTFNNDNELDKTLSSVSMLPYKPYELIVVDGAESNTAKKVAEKYAADINVRYIGKRDCGVYDGMNNGLLAAKGDVIHYLNSGDVVGGDPYRNWAMNQLLDVWLTLEGTRLGKVKLQLSKTHYSHQGMLFPNPHPMYDMRYRIASDYDMIRRVFSGGFDRFFCKSDGYVEYDYGGISSTRKVERDKEIGRIINEHDGRFSYYIFSLIRMIKNVLPYELVVAVRKTLYKSR